MTTVSPAEIDIQSLAFANDAATVFTQVSTSNGLPVSATIVSGGGGAVTIVDGGDVTQGAIADVAYVSGSGTVVAILKGIFGKVSSLVTGTVLAAGSAIIGAVTGGTASGSSLTANPLTIGGRAATTQPTAVTDGQVVNAQYSKTGKAVSIGALRTQKSDQQTQLSNTTSETTIITAGAAGVFNDLYGLILANTGASTTKVTIRDGVAGTIRAILVVPALDTRGFMLPVDSGFSQATAAVAWTAQCGTATTALEVSAFFAQNI